MSNFDYDYMKPTRPIGPIAADFKSPGPAYKLPSLVGHERHDPLSNHARLPAWTMPGRYPDKHIMNDSPGPIYNPTETPRDGVSLKGRLPPLRPDTAPGPGAYSPEHSGPAAQNGAPAYTFGTRQMGRRDDPNPGPGAYNPEKYGSDGRGAVLTSRHQSFGDDASPGPAAYYLGPGDRGPAASIKGRPVDSVEGVGPGPASYYPKLGGKNGFTIAGRHSGPETAEMPGPGYYLPDTSPVAKSAPAYSMASRPRDGNRDRSPGPADYYSPRKDDGPYATIKGRFPDIHKESGPGPGAYAPEVSGPSAYKTTPRFSFGTRTGLANKDSGPGPGAYYPTTDRKDGVSFGQRHHQSDEDYSPGPAAYYLGPGNRGPAATIKGRPVDSVEGVGPGPASYYPKLGGKNGFTIAGRHRGPETDEMPGPGYYLPDTSPVAKSAPAYSMASRPRDGNRDRSPGPADYYSPRKDEGPYATIKGRFPDIHKESGPGPGAYAPEVSGPSAYKTTPRFSFGTRTGLNNKDSGPGPGAYYPLTDRKDGVSFGQRHHQTGEDQSPGPAAYNPNSSRSGPAASIKGRPVDSMEGVGPGPASYYPKLGGKNGFTIAGRHPGPETDDAPGPGYYLPDTSGVSEAAPAYSMAFRPHDANKNHSPGPADYYYYDNKSSGPYATIKGRYPDVQKDPGPGPGAYAPEVSGPSAYKSTPRFSFGMRTGSAPKDSGPGPDTYYVEPPRKGGVSMGSRHRWAEEEKSPGPARYDVGSSRGGPSYSISGRHQGVTDSASPGPGYYYPDINPVAKSDPAWSMGGRHNVIVVDGAPGPGAYYPDTSRKGPAFSIAGRHPVESRDRSPGPADYQYYNFKNTGPYATIKGRHPERLTSDVPGPGAYSTDQLGPSAVSKGPAFSFGSRPRIRYMEDQPGPNLYMPDPMLGDTVRSTKPKAPAFSMGGKTARMSTEQTPGPADYRLNTTSLRGGPAYSMSSRPDINYTSADPGPADYRPLYGAVDPLKGLSFGVRHSPHKVDVADRKGIY